MHNDIPAPEARPWSDFGSQPLGSVSARALFLVALAFSVFQVYTSAYHMLSSQVVRAVHVGFLLWLTFVIHAPAVGGRSFRLLGWALGLTGLAAGLYQWVFESDLIVRAGDPSSWDLVVGTVLIVLVFDAARRVMGWALPLICGTFILYALLGQYLPGSWAHRGYGYDQVVEQLAFGTEGIYGTPIFVSSSYIFLFILFGAFLEQAGMIRLFTDFALGTVGHSQGGPAKVAVVSSGLMGTISGSGVANVVMTGQFTIPLMKRFGYKPAFAGGVEATASMGGQIMPPVMGAVAFIMAETINVPYLEIAKAALIPALLYFFTAFWMVHLEAGRGGLRGLDKKDCPNPWQALAQGWHLLLPLGLLVFLLFAGFTPLFAGSVGLAITGIIVFAAAVALKLPGRTLRVVFWLALAAVCSGFLAWGIAALYAVFAVLALWLLATQGIKGTVWVAVRALADGAVHALPVGVACALVGVIVGVLSLTGAASSVADTVLSLGQGHLMLSLLLTMLVCLLLGMGIPTIPNYIITSSLAAPALLELGVPLIVSHMFVFYFGILADLTPPVALAAFAAAPIAGASGLSIGVQAVKIAMAGFVVPFMAVYSPELMLQGDWTVISVAYIVFKALLAIVLWGMAAVGYWKSHLRLWQRAWALGAALLLVVAAPITDELGLAGAALLLGGLWWTDRRSATAE